MNSINQATPATIARTLFLLFALVNQILSIFHLSPLNIAVDETELATSFSVLFTIAASVTAWWKNNSFTTTARKADEVLRQEKEKATEITEQDTEEN
ncbi:phage holin [Listeria fleischmannii]|uniref:Putative holin n=1 Tax=Listeria fleischmannii FSL S10-1203 TaxID=1265822 RepID=W7DGJ4_9LIST|nr:phage holin [Listeria fleischmannii]EUJ59567.1 putative holin [Listeria fleischmannii FSL S10-1203]